MRVHLCENPSCGARVSAEVNVRVPSHWVEVTQSGESWDFCSFTCACYIINQRSAKEDRVAR